MGRPRFAHKTTDTRSDDPFNDAEECWFWYVRCQQARLEGRAMDRGRPSSRPCDPDDVYRAVMHLHRTRRIADGHLRVLGYFGFLARPPDRRCRQEEAASRLWDEALDLLGSELRAKGIVA